jgi:hypothetical protein
LGGVAPNIGSFNNTNVSYFVGVGASDTYPQGILGGDRNLGGTANNGTTPDPNYGFSPAVGSTTGNDVELFTNGVSYKASQNTTYPSSSVGWSAKIHTAGNVAGAGNVLLGDGSAQQVTSAGFRQNWLRNAGPDGSVFVTQTDTTKNSVRLMFP